jgi:hypothetical protein
MTKKFLIAAMGAAIVAGAHAQAPVLNHVKSLDEPFVGVAPNLAVLSGAGFQPCDVAVVGDTMFYTTWGTGGGTNNLKLIRITNWNKPSATWEIYGQANNVGGAARNNQIIVDKSAPNRIWWATNLTNSGPVTIYRVKTDGTALTDWLSLGTDALADGILTNTEAQPLVTGQWGAATVNPHGVSFDPGFGPNPTPALALWTFGSYMVRRVDLNTGRMILADGVAVPKSATATYLSNSFRDAAYDESGNAWAKAGNEMYYMPRSEQGQNKVVGGVPTAFPADYFAGFTTQTKLTNPDLLTSSNGSFSNIVYVPAATGQDAFLINTNRDPSNTSKIVLNNPATGATISTITSGFNQFGDVLGLTSPGIQGIDYADVNGQRYVFIASFKSSVQGVDIYQIGDAGKISGAVTLEGWVGDGVNFLSQNFTVEVRDLSDNLLDSRTFAGGATTTNFSFITTARGPVTITIDGATFLKRRQNATIGAAETVFNTTLLNGDVDADAEVGPSDFEAVVEGFGLAFGDVGYQSGSDLDKDGEIGPSDFEIVVSNFGLGDE